MSFDANPNAPNKALPLLPVQQSLADIVKGDFPVDVLHRHSVTFDLSAGPYSISQSMFNFPGFSESVLSASMYVELESVEIVLDSFSSGCIVGCALSHNPEASATLPVITAQKSHFTFRTTDLSMNTVNHTLPFYSGMTKQLKPTPINGNYPQMLVFTSVVGQGALNLVFNYRRGGPVITRSDWNLPLNPNPTQQPALEPLLPTDGSVVVVKHASLALLDKDFNFALNNLQLSRADVFNLNYSKDQESGQFVINFKYNPSFRVCSLGKVPVGCYLVNGGPDDMVWLFKYEPKPSSNLLGSLLEELSPLEIQRTRKRESLLPPASSSSQVEDDL